MYATACVEIECCAYVFQVFILGCVFCLSVYLPHPNLCELHSFVVGVNHLHNVEFF